MAAVKIPHGRVWNNGEAMLLLQEWKDKNKQTNKQNYYPVQEGSLYGKKLAHF